MPLFDCSNPGDGAPSALAAAIHDASDRCVACGLCLPHCPTYRDSLNENESPRGRISLLAAAARGTLPVTSALSTHIDHCLGCLACEKVCPSHVPYGALLRNGRAWLNQNHPGTWRRRLYRSLIRGVDVPGAMAMAYGVARLIGSLPPGSRAARTGLGSAVHGLPARPRPALADPGDGRAADVALFRGCTADLDRPALNAAIRILRAAGQRVSIPRAQGCCGALAAHAGFADIACRQRLRNNEAFEAAAPALVSVASGCAAELRHDHPRPGAGFPAVYDVHRYLVEKTDLARLALAPLPRTLAVHDPCSLRNALGGERFVYEVLARIPEIRLVELPGNAVCCGAAGDYFLREPARAQALARSKADAAREAGADMVVSANIGCALHLSAALARQGSPIPVHHPLWVVARQLPPARDPC
ncbi:(Fe-S)-binding protein [Acidiferrobacter sp.]|uniref:(Fe-S)-binding protein n=1 Tax=Acidiferrobacter sp. TaxID=1872107 RepID=UPI0026085ECB|nr:(Fe-S)-binding protein [Acidiferrobacter sp.]